MKKVVLRYGTYSILLIIGLFLLTFLIFRNNENYAVQEILGWASMALAMVFVFFGMKYYRDHINNGQLSFGQGMKLGLLIVLLPSVAFGIFNAIYVLYINPGFMDKYYTYQVELAKATVPAAQLAAALQEMEQQKAFFSNTFMSSAVMALSVFIVGLIATVIFTFILKRGKKVQYA